jgi:hypothetical protein
MPPKYTRLIHLCSIMQGLNGDESSYLDARRAGDMIGVDPMKAWRWLTKVLCHPDIGILQLIEKGNERRRNRYRYVASRDKVEPEATM